MSRDARWSLRIKTLGQAKALARRRLPRPVFDYIEGAAGRERTAADNVQAFADVTFVPRMGATYGDQPRDTSITLFGHRLTSPVLLGPVGFTRSMHVDGDVAGRRAGASHGTIFCQSSMSGHEMADVANAASSPWWFQLYPLGGRQGCEQLLARAEELGADALVITLDTPVPGNRERDLAYGASLPIRVNRHSVRHLAPWVLRRPRWLAAMLRDGFHLQLALARGLHFDGVEQSEDMSLLRWMVEPLTWDDVEWIRARWPRRMLIKGILSAADAERAIAAGADGIIVSNHGGRQLDQTLASLVALRDVATVAKGRVALLVDGGISRGSDVAIALSLGADAVLIGRAWAYGVAAAGQAGVERILSYLHVDFARTMQLLGVRTVDEIGPDLVRIPSEWP
jgi:L-lactate dehydrogenase (cytochrome)